MTTTGPESETARVEGFCAVTVVCGERRLDVALPTRLAWADLEPSLLRLLFADQPPDRVGRWVLTPVGRADLDPTETLSSAGIVAADVLQLRQSTGAPAVPGVVHNVRDRVEDLVDGRDQSWGRRESRSFVLWSAVVVGAVVLVATVVAAGSAGGGAVVDLPLAPGPVLTSGLLAGTVAVVFAMTAILAARTAETCCAAVALAVGCGWAAVAGAVAVCRWAASSAGPTSTMMVAAGAAAALLTAGCSVAFYPGALVHTVALLTVGGIASAVAVAVRAGAPAAETGCLAALASTLAIGAVPRLALALCGVGGGGADIDPVRLDARIGRADGVLTGIGAGLSLAAVLGAAPAALSSDGWHRAFVLGLGLLLMLRSRVFSQVRHALAARVGAMVVFAELVAGLAIDAPALLTPLILGAVAALALAVTVLAGPQWAPVSRARVGRTLDLLELGLVFGMVLLAAGLLGCFGALPGVMG